MPLQTHATAAGGRPALAGALRADRAELGHVLCVEDDADIRAVCELALGAVGHMQVTLSESGQMALELAPRVLPDLILLDVMMPGMDGIETLHRLKALPATAGIPVVFMTARVQPHEIASYVELGAIGVIAKPFDPMRLAGEIRAMFDAHAG